MLRLGRFVERPKRSAETAPSVRGERGPGRSAAGGAPGGAAPLRHWGARVAAAARGGPSQGSPGCLASTRRLPALHFPCVQGRRKMGKGDARRPRIEVRGRRSVVCLTSEYDRGLSPFEFIGESWVCSAKMVIVGCRVGHQGVYARLP